jgi:hypothetical protein
MHLLKIRVRLPVMSMTEIMFAVLFLKEVGLIKTVLVNPHVSAL